MESSGSPPRRRGKAAQLAYVSLFLRITPAWAGKRRCTAACIWLCWDHPRVGGEKAFASSSMVCSSGSPPRKRGKVIVLHDGGAGPRITPAWAGKRMPTMSWDKQNQDHPRVGGEKARDRASVVMVKGSPPRGRGKDSFIVHCHACVGITPAWAGKRHINVCKVCVSEDHPRVGGEKCSSKLFVKELSGSPPRGRGKVLRIRPLRNSVRITPAWAGKRSQLPCKRPDTRDHPRVGGEKCCSEV